jgi:hypothetical protein
MAPGSVRSRGCEPPLGSEPLLLGAVPIKSELIREVQEAYFRQVWQVVMMQWRLVTRAVRDADSFIIVGYGFPTEDQYGRFLFGEAMRLRAKPPRSIEFYELADRAECTESAIRSAFGRCDLQPDYTGPVKPAPLEA